MTALYLVGCLPVLATRIVSSKYKGVYFLLLFMIVICIVLLRCRTAYIGMGVMAVVMVYSKLKFFFSAGKPNYFYSVCTGVMLLTLVLLACVRMYSMKKDSADGRLLIWKLSAEMIKEQPQGYNEGRCV
ncbi:O-antigen ligase family protein [Xylanibacter muris]|uniref:O-antigen ligase-related domain-containing protein n=1 Tax=Xylanibacter muris TaxID=2736290 RepID=A0ABX2ALX2_9BACT|nr:O-antigen ligase family protein [Xylanibacter muris]NPD91042.1 hypothetical protein [Xylanibacter muris]